MIHTIIVSAGSGNRFGSDIPKQYLSIHNKTILRYSVEIFSQIGDVSIVINPNHRDLCMAAVDGLDVKEIVAGGDTRQESVFNGLKAIEKYAPKKVLIHDAARPFITLDVIGRVVDALDEHKAVIPMVHATDTIKLVEDGFIKSTLDRTKTMLTQTPQGFIYSDIYQAHKDAVGKGNFTDDGGIAEFAGIPQYVVLGDSANYKITTKEDMK